MRGWWKYGLKLLPMGSKNDGKGSSRDLVSFMEGPLRSGEQKGTLYHVPSLGRVLSWDVVGCFCTFSFTGNQWESSNWKDLGSLVIAMITFFFPFRRLNTLNKCASMKLDVNFQRKKVGAIYYTLLRPWLYQQDELRSQIKNNTNLSEILKWLTVICVYSPKISSYHKHHDSARQEPRLTSVSLCFSFDQRVCIQT